MINERVWPLNNGITGHWRQTKFNESALLGESGVKLREVKINLAHFPVSPDFWLSYRLWKELDRQGIRFSLLSESKIRSVGGPVTLHYTDLTEDWDVVHVVVVRQGRHESVAETRLAAPHAPLVLLAPGEPHHGHRDQLAGTSDGCRVPASESEASWNGNKVRSLWPTQLKSWPQLEDDTRQILRTEISGGDAILCQEGGLYPIHLILMQLRGETAAFLHLWSKVNILTTYLPQNHLAECHYFFWVWGKTPQKTFSDSADFVT